MRMAPRDEARQLGSRAEPRPFRPQDRRTTQRDGRDYLPCFGGAGRPIKLTHKLLTSLTNLLSQLLCYIAT